MKSVINKSGPPNVIFLNENFFQRQMTLKPRNLQFLMASCKILVRDMKKNQDSCLTIGQSCTGNKVEEIQTLERQSPALYSNCFELPWLLSY